MNRRHTSARRSRGISLVELMIGLTLSLFILGALARAFGFASESRRSQESIARLMDGGRSATETIGRALRLATYWGCTGADSLDISVRQDARLPANSTTHYANRGLFGVESGNTARDELITWQALDNARSPLTSRISFAPASIDPDTGDVTNDPDQVLQVNDQTLFAPPSGSGAVWVSLNNCQTADIFPLEGSGMQHACGGCSRTYSAGATLQRIQRNRFYIATGARGRPSLFLSRDDAAGVELVEGVESLEILYALDNDLNGVVDVRPPGGPPGLDYKTATQVTALCSSTNVGCWDRVASVRISLLMSSVEDGVVPEPQSYYFNGTLQPAPTDRRLRREFVSVVAIRNARS